MSSLFPPLTEALFAKKVDSLPIVIGQLIEGGPFGVDIAHIVCVCRE